MVSTTVEVWTPVTNWIMHSRAGPQKVLGPDVGLSSRWRYEFWEKGLGTGGWTGPQVEIWIEDWTSRSWNGGLDYCGYLDSHKGLVTGFEDWVPGWPSVPWHEDLKPGCRSDA